MRILFITDNFPPEVNAPATRTFEHCTEWIAQGHEVTVITCVPNFPKGQVFEGYRNKWKQEEQIQGIRVIRVWSYITANKGFARRVIDYLSFGIMAVLAGVRVKADLIVATSPQFFSAMAGHLAGRLKRLPWIMEVRDLWPESIAAVGMIDRRGVLYRLLSWLEMRMYKSASEIVVVTKSFANTIQSRGIVDKKIHVVRNGVYPIEINHVNVASKRKDELGLQDKFVIGFIGTHGLSHALDFVIQSAAQMDDDAIHFILIGDGASKDELVKIKSDLNISNVTMLDSVPRQEVWSYIQMIDAALVNLKKAATFKTVIPSKIFENAVMGKPILLGVEGESADMIRSYGAGICFEPENTQQFIQSCKAIKDDLDLYKRCSEGAKRLARDHDRRILAGRMLDVFERYDKNHALNGVDKEKKSSHKISMRT